jgi:mevalonate kinase
MALGPGARVGRGAGRGKVILVGEHAVVHGHPALAAALDARVLAEARPSDRTSASLDGSPAPPPVGEAVARVLAALGAPPLEVTCASEVPARAGLGSSAALAVAVARAAADACGRRLEMAELLAAANEAERTFHGNPSGVDVALAARGGIGLFRRGRGLESLALPRFALAIGISGEPRDTHARVADVAARLAAEPEATGRRLAALGEMALAARDRVAARAWPELGALFDRAHEELEALGLASPGLSRLVTLARAAGAAGAKLTGAGGGGAAIALAPGREAAIVAAWRAAGFHGFVAEVGG